MSLLPHVSKVAQTWKPLPSSWCIKHFKLETKSSSPKTQVAAVHSKIDILDSLFRSTKSNAATKVNIQASSHINVCTVSGNTYMHGLISLSTQTHPKCTCPRYIRAPMHGVDTRYAFAFVCEHWHQSTLPEANHGALTCLPVHTSPADIHVNLLAVAAHPRVVVPVLT